MAKFLGTTSIVNEIEKVVSTAKEYLYLISPYWKTPDIIIQKLRMADARGVRIFVIYGKKQKDIELEIEKLRALKNIAIFYLENLHAKCYGNESKTILTSLNLLNWNMQGNIEVGTVLNEKDDAKAFSEARNEMIRMFSLSVGIYAPKDIAKYMISLQEKYSEERMRPVMANEILAQNLSEPKSIYEKKSSSKEKAINYGTCLRCGDDIKFNSERPLCRDCYSEWSEYGNFFFGEDFCHKCGNKANTSMAKPLCYNCYKS